MTDRERNYWLDALLGTGLILAIFVSGCVATYWHQDGKSWVDVYIHTCTFVGGWAIPLTIAKTIGIPLGAWRRNRKGAENATD